MAHLHVCQLSEAISFLPDLEQFDASKYKIDMNVDVFLCALGFEPRTLTVPEALAQNNYRAEKAVYFEYETNREDNDINRPQLLQALNQISDSVQSVECDEPGFSKTLRSLIEPAERAIGSDNTREPIVMFDISTAADRLIMKCMKALLELHVRLIILYSEAAVYHPTQDEYRKDPRKWAAEGELGLERGVWHIRISEEYPGYHIDQLPDCILIFPSFKKERARAVIANIDPSLLTSEGDKVVWLLGVPRLENDKWRLDAMRTINELKPGARQYEISTFDYKETIRTLETIYQERTRFYRFNLCQMGSKLQAIGSSLFCYAHPDIKVVYATPKEYNASQYSDGCKQLYFLDLGSVAELRKSLDAVGTLTIRYS
jgi:hypothetical protein